MKKDKTQKKIDKAHKATLLYEWRKPVLDYQEGREVTKHQIEKYFTEVAPNLGATTQSWQWFLDEYSDGTYTEQWKDKPWQEWCGLLQAWVGLNLWKCFDKEDKQCKDIYMNPKLASNILPGTGRLASSGTENDFYEKSDLEPPVDVPIHEVMMGDFFTTGDGPYGSHICFCTRREGDRVRSIEGNTNGLLPGNEWGEGVVKKKRGVGEIKSVYRFDHRKDHYLGAVTSNG